jgi:hypothetical protein
LGYPNIVLLSSENVADVLHFLTLQNMHNMPNLSINIKKIICTAAKVYRKKYCVTMLFPKLLQVNLHFPRIRVMVFNATFNDISIISWQSVLLVEETGVFR